MRKPNEMRESGGDPEPGSYWREWRRSLVLSALILSLFPGSFYADYCISTSLRLTRRMEYLRDAWSAVLPIEVLTVVGVVAVVLSFASVCVFWVRLGRRLGKLKSKVCIIGVVTNLLMTASFVCYAIGYSPQDRPGYILVVPMMGLAVLLNGFQVEREMRKKPEDWDTEDE